MFSRELTVSDLERLDRIATAAVEALQMDEDSFRAFYDRTARQVWAYLARITGDRSVADDLLQEAYYRFLRAERAFTSESHRRNYLFRIATNLAHDHRRRPRVELPSTGNEETFAAPGETHSAEHAARRIDLARAMQQLKPRERSMLWLAYAQGWSHEEIAQSIGVKTSSMKALLHRARRKLVDVMGKTGGKS